MKKCPFCGASLDDYDFLCPACGSLVTLDNSAPEDPQTPETADTADSIIASLPEADPIRVISPAKRRKPKKVNGYRLKATVVSAAVAVILIIACTFAVKSLFRPVSTADAPKADASTADTADTLTADTADPDTSGTDAGEGAADTEDTVSYDDVPVYDTFYPWDCMKVSFAGYNGGGTAEVSVYGNNEVMNALTITCSPSSGLSNGDEVEIVFSYNGISETDAFYAALAQDFGAAPDSREVYCTVEGLPNEASYDNKTYICIDENNVQALSDYTRGVIDYNVATTWGSKEHLNYAEFVGLYIYDNGSGAEDATYFVVYKNEAQINKDGSHVFDYYYCLTVTGVSYDSSGNIVLSGAHYETPENVVHTNVYAGSVEYYYRGYNTLDELVSTVKGTHPNHPENFTCYGDLPVF